MKTIRQRLSWKLFLSYLVVILVGVASLAVAAELHAPTALDRHIAGMAAAMGGATSGMLDGMRADLTASFRRAVNEVLAVAVAAAGLSAALMSLFASRRIVRPIQEMEAASRRIAQGRYEERVQVVSEDELGGLAHSFNQMAHRLAETEERRRQLIGDVAHELRTPLSNIKSVMEGLQDGILPTEPATFLNVQREVGRLQRLVYDLEELSKAEAGQIPLTLEEVDPATIVSTAVDRLALQYDDKGVQLQTELPSGLPSLKVDPARMTQVMLNLLGNALQYTPSGGRVVVRASATSHELLIAVQDTGIGLAAEDLRHIFERFYRVDKSRSRAGGGSGIGLTIARHLVEAHKGRLTATSPGPGQGSTFTVSLPVIQ